MCTLNLWNLIIFNKILWTQFYDSTLNFINFHEKYIKFYVYVHKYIF